MIGIDAFSLGKAANHVAVMDFIAKLGRRRIEKVKQEADDKHKETKKDGGSKEGEEYADEEEGEEEEDEDEEEGEDEEEESGEGRIRR